MRLAELLGDAYRNEVHCAECECSMMHLVSVGVVQEDFTTVVTRNRHDVIPSPTPGRGSIVWIKMRCENCPWESRLSFRFHKGATYVDVDAMEMHDGGNYTELWRD